MTGHAEQPDIRQWSFLAAGRAEKSSPQIRRLGPAVLGSGPGISAADRAEVSKLPWWGYVLFLIVVAVAVWGFVSLVRFRTRDLSRKTDRTAEDMYPTYADSASKQRRFAQERGGQWRDEDPPGPG